MEPQDRVPRTSWPLCCVERQSTTELGMDLGAWVLREGPETRRRVKADDVDESSSAPETLPRRLGAGPGGEFHLGAPDGVGTRRVPSFQSLCGGCHEGRTRLKSRGWTDWDFKKSWTKTLPDRASVEIHLIRTLGRGLGLRGGHRKSGMAGVCGEKKVRPSDH